MSILEKKVEDVVEGTKLREYLKREMGISTRLIRSASIQKRIFINNEVVKMNRVIKNGEIIKIDLEKEESHANFQCGMAHHEDYLDGRQADQQGFDRRLVRAL